MKAPTNTICPVCLQRFELGAQRVQVGAAGRGFVWVHSEGCAATLGEHTARAAKLALDAGRGYLRRRFPRVSFVLEGVASFGRYRRQTRHGRT